MARSLLSLAAALALTAPAAAQSLERGFDPAKDWPRFPRLFGPSNTSAERKATYTPDGIVFEVSGGPGTNVMYNGETRIAGDFQAEVRYQIDAIADKVIEATDKNGKRKYGQMFGIRAVIDDKDGDAAMNRGVYGRDGHAYHAGRMIPLPSDKRFASRGVPSTSRHGRMGLRRVGDKMQYLASDTPDGPFQLVTEYPFPAGKPVSRIGLYADGGGQPMLLKGRLYDFVLKVGADVPTDVVPAGPKATELTALPTPQDFAAKPVAPPSDPKVATSPPPSTLDAPAEPAPAPVRGQWWLVGVAVVLAVVIGVVIGRRTGRADPPRPSAPARPQPRPAPPVARREPPADPK